MQRSRWVLRGILGRLLGRRRLRSTLNTFGSALIEGAAVRDGDAILDDAAVRSRGASLLASMTSMISNAPRGSLEDKLYVQAGGDGADGVGRAQAMLL